MGFAPPNQSPAGKEKVSSASAVWWTVILTAWVPLPVTDPPVTLRVPWSTDSVTVTLLSASATLSPVIGALVTATLLGYYFGRRAGSSPSSWKKRTSRIALGRLAMSLLVLMTARRVRHGFRAERVLPIWRLRTIAPLELLRGGVARMRSY